MKSLSRILSLFILILILQSGSTQTLTIVLSRYGARSPEVQSTYAPSSYWSSFDELTPVGMRQQFILGSALQLQYINQTTYNPANTFSFAQDYNLTLMSAYSQTYGIYQNQGPNIPSNITNLTLTYPPYNTTLLNQVNSQINFSSALPFNFMPIPIHSIEPSEDFILESYENCQNLNPAVQSHLNDSTVQWTWNIINTQTIPSL